MGRLRYALSPLALIDLIAIAPAFVVNFVMFDMRTLRIFRLLRYLRLLRLGRFSQSIQLIGRALSRAREDLHVAVVVMLMMLMFASTLMFFAEHDAQPQKFTSIPATMWWAVSTLTTVGYGDIIPVTTTGKLIGAVVSILGIGMFAMPTAIVSASFMEEFNATKNANKAPPRCPHCGKTMGAEGEEDTI
jgi:voltage-gated potassium channel